MRAAIRLLRAVPVALELCWLKWAQREIHPQHPDVLYLARRIAELESKQ